VNKPQQLTVSVIIPCYNEQKALSRCLKALKAQSIVPFEIIVVDNNSTDDTAAVAKSFKVRVIKEKTQGVIAARNRGMHAARGDILARIDADTEVSKDWVAAIIQTFNNSGAVAVTGTGDFYDLPFDRGSRAVRNFFAITLNRIFLGHHMLWGSNMAIRRQAWHAIAQELCHRQNIMEDLDMAMHINDSYGLGSIVYSDRIIANISARRATAGLFRNYMYMKMWPETLRMHRGRRSHLLWPAVGITVILVGSYTAGVFRIYDGDTRSWRTNPRTWFVKNNYDQGNP
jgi:glycosyltransferase involved in cell wall biosynthesis